jgi:phosphoenolpyruvate carboxykinase (ATP)
LDYDNESSKLAKLFSENFKQFNVDESIIAAGPIEVSE